MKPAPLKNEEIQKNPDPHIDQDFPGYPHLPADKKSITLLLWLKRNWPEHTKRNQKRYMAISNFI